MKAKKAAEVKNFTDIPNIDAALAKDFNLLGIKKPAQLKSKNAYKLYDQLCLKTGARQDPCVLDVFLAAVDFMNGAPTRPWWNYTPQRKRQLKAIYKSRKKE